MVVVCHTFACCVAPRPSLVLYRQIVYVSHPNHLIKHSLLDFHSFEFCVVPLFCEESHFSGPVLCSQHSPVIIPVASPEVSSLETSVELVRGAVSSTERHSTAAPNFR